MSGRPKFLAARDHTYSATIIYGRQTLQVSFTGEILPELFLCTHICFLEHIIVSKRMLESYYEDLYITKYALCRMSLMMLAALVQLVVQLSYVATGPIKRLLNWVVASF